jgi:HNH endonuclease
MKVFIPIKKAGKVFVSKMDFADYVALNVCQKRPWIYWGGNRLDKQPYAMNKSHISIHRLIASPPSGFVVDHIDGNTLNNTRENLRVCTYSQNSANAMKKKFKQGKPTSLFKGVFYNKQNKNWRCRIQLQGAVKEVGSFRHERDAAEAYNKAAVELFGEFAKLNDLGEKTWLQ